MERSSGVDNRRYSMGGKRTIRRRGRIGGQWGLSQGAKRAVTIKPPRAVHVVDDFKGAAALVRGRDRATALGSLGPRSTRGALSELKNEYAGRALDLNLSTQFFPNFFLAS